METNAIKKFNNNDNNNKLSILLNTGRNITKPMMSIVISVRNIPKNVMLK